MTAISTVLNTPVETIIEQWLQKQIREEVNPRRRELLLKGLGHATLEFLKNIWYPTIGNLDFLYPEWEIRDFSNRYRYLDLAYIPNQYKGCIEIHGYRSHARDIEAWRFKDLCMKQALLTLDDWRFIPIAYLSIIEEQEMCKQLILSFVGKILSVPIEVSLNWSEAETLRFARRIMRPFQVEQLASHLKYTIRQTRRIIHNLLDMELLVVVDSKQRYRSYQLPNSFSATKTTHYDLEKKHIELSESKNLDSFI